MFNQQDADLQKAISNSLKDYEIPPPLNETYKLNFSLAADGRCFSASVFYTFNDYNTYKDDVELNNWIQDHIVNPITRLGSNNFFVVLWVYKFLMFSEEILLKNEEERREIQNIVQSVYGRDFDYSNLNDSKLKTITENEQYHNNLYPAYFQYIQTLNYPTYIDEGFEPYYTFTEPQYGPGDILAMDPAYNKNIQIVTPIGINKSPGYFYGMEDDPKRETVYIFYNNINHYMPLEPKNLVAYREMERNRFSHDNVIFLPDDPSGLVNQPSGLNNPPTLNQPSYSLFDKPPSLNQSSFSFFDNTQTLNQPAFSLFDKSPSLNQPSFSLFNNSPTLNQASVFDNASGLDNPQTLNQPSVFDNASVFDKPSALNQPSVLNQPTFNFRPILKKQPSKPIEIVEEEVPEVPEVDMKRICKRFKNMNRLSNFYGGRTCKKKKVKSVKKMSKRKRMNTNTKRRKCAKKLKTRARRRIN